MRPATGSALISCGETRVICTASVQESVPRWMTGKGRGWLTAEYGMLPASTGDRKQRDVSKGRPDGRTVEIQRLIGRSLRGIVDFEALGERTVYVDCDVLQADGGTRCASITGGYVALELACRRLLGEGKLAKLPLTGTVAAVSCGVVDGEPLLDLDYPEDSSAEVDANVVMTGDGGLVEVQATAERTPLSRAHLDELLALAADGDRGPARGAGRRDAVDARSCSPPATPTSSASSAACCRTSSSSRCPSDVELPPETGETFAENALEKARAASAGDRRAGARRRLGHRGRGARRRPRRVLRPLRRAEPRPTPRTATGCAPRCRPASGLRYVCVVAYVAPGEAPRLAEGRCEGRMAEAPRGERGFGYDPLFVPADGDGRRTMAELSDAEKDRISHRGRAAREAAAWLAGA